MKKNRHTIFLTSMAALAIILVGGVSALAGDCGLARDYYAKGVNLLNYEARRAAFQKAVELCPSYAEAHNNLADALENIAAMGKGRGFDEKSFAEGHSLLDQAVKHYARALELNKSLYQAHIGLGEIFLGQGRYEPAANEFKKALEINPGNDQATTGLAQAKKLMAQDSGRTLRRAAEIVARVKDPSRDGPAGRLMGVESHTVRDRESFSNILFAGWSSQIAPGEPTEQLNEIGKALSSQELAGFRFVIEGHTNSVGGFEENMNLSWERARSVKQHLVRNFGIHPQRLVVLGHGYTKTKVLPDSAPENRRVEVLFLQDESGR